MIDCTLVTCEKVSALDPDDRTLLHALRERGLTVSSAVWSDPQVDWAGSRLCVLRSTWDYHSRYRDFLIWIERAAAVTAIRNDPHLLRWNAHKAYLRELELLGVPIVATVWITQGATRGLAELSEAHGWRELVIKPAHGAAAHSVMRVGREAEALALGQAHLDGLVQTQDALVQPYLSAVAAYGERALIFFEGRYSHAVVKKPFNTVLAVGDARSARVEAAEEEIEVASKAVMAVPAQPLYARVDLLRDDAGNVRVNEVELIEPSLYLTAHDPARGTFADAIERELDAVVKLEPRSTAS
jgi:glutathione synthase/RimK-type ligase-like ATP-grasp enzyme